MRKKAVQSLDSRQLTLIENAFFYCNPPERQKVLFFSYYPIKEGGGVFVRVVTGMCLKTQ